MIRRINIWGGPGCGKSTVTAWLFAHLKISGHDVQFVEEYVKRWAYQKRPVIGFDQMHLTTCQIVAEDELLRNGVKHIITDCPCMISCFYANRDKLPYAPLLVEMGRHMERVYPSINVFLLRAVPYQTQGRYETEEEAKQLDDKLLDFLQSECEHVIVASPKELEPLLKCLDDTLRRAMSDKPELVV